MTPSTITLAKYHGTGNDFLVVSAPDGPLLSADDVVALCDRFRGIGADGLIELRAGRDGADATMLLRNADGSEAQMSGNGIRALAAFAAERGLGTRTTVIVDTAAGRRAVELERAADDTVIAATVDMGSVTFEPARIPVSVERPFDLVARAEGTEYRGDAAGMGNPHLVIRVDDPDRVPVSHHGAILEADPRFPDRTNVEFVTVEPDGAIRMRVFERGVGETQSCGTGACAAAAVLHRRGVVPSSASVRVPGGELTVELGDPIRLRGPVVRVFEADVDPTKIRERR